MLTTTTETQQNAGRILIRRHRFQSPIPLWLLLRTHAHMFSTQRHVSLSNGGSAQLRIAKLPKSNKI
jgi:ribosomal protein L39E